MVDEPITLQELRVRDVQVTSHTELCKQTVVVILLAMHFMNLPAWLVCRMSHMLAGGG